MSCSYEGSICHNSCLSERNYQRYIMNKYHKYKITQSRDNGAYQYCSTDNKHVQNHQLFLSEFIAETDNLLVFHLTGSGKTCVAIQIIKKLESTYDVFLVTSASLISSFEQELITQPCGNPKNEMNKYNVLSIHRFVNKIKNEDLGKKYRERKTLLIIDEAHNVVSATGTFYASIHSFVRQLKNRKLVLMTATPIVDNPKEFCLLTNLFRKHDIDSSEFVTKFIRNNDLINRREFSNMCRGYISFYAGAPDYTYPRYTIKYVKCPMTGEQLEAYSLENILNPKKESFLPDKSPFYMELRKLANVMSYNIDYSNIKRYSSKFDALYKKLDLTKKTFIYSAFREESGISSFCKFIESMQIKEYKWKYYFDCSSKELKNRHVYKYMLWSGRESTQEKMAAKKVFDNPKNINGEYIKLAIGSPSSKEGLSFKCVRQVHILEPHWNWSRVYQIYSRAVRFCSHVELPESSRTVDVFIYISTLKGSKSIDEYIIDMIKDKQALNNKFLNAMVNESVDKLLFGYDKYEFPKSKFS